MSRTATITIPGALPAMNEILTEAKRHYAKYSSFKKRNTLLVSLHASRAPRFGCVDVVITWYCKDKRKDKDNIMGGQKFIFDGLQDAGVLQNDGWKQIRDITHKFRVDKKNPRVEITLVEVEEEEAA